MAAKPEVPSSCRESKREIIELDASHPTGMKSKVRSSNFLLGLFDILSKYLIICMYI